MYFLFQEPIQTTPEDVKDRARCDELYRQAPQAAGPAAAARAGAELARRGGGSAACHAGGGLLLPFLQQLLPAPPINGLSSPPPPQFADHRSARPSSCLRCRQTKASVQEGLGWLLEQRQRDPYRDFLPRLAREAAYPGQQAPTFPVNP